jgi:O-antigen/teichoic acid export membrane protein
MLNENISYIPILIFFTTFFTFFDSYAKSLFDAVIGTFLRDFLVKFLNLLLIILYIYGFIDFEKFVLFYVLIYISPLIIILLILIKRKQIYFILPNKKLLKKYKNEIIKVAIFGVVSGFSGIAVMNIDKAMVTDYIGIDEMGVYAVSFYFGVLISLPGKPLRKISSIILAEAWKNNNINEIMTVYRKSISNLLLIGTLIYVGIIINIDNIFKIIPDYISGKNVILLIGGAYLVEMFSGTSAIIIASSKYYKVHAYIMLLTIGLVVITNLLFIPIWHLSGAAFASFITIVIASLIRYVFLLNKFKLQPYFYKHFIIIGIGGLMIIINYFIPKSNNFIIDILIRSSIISLLFIYLSYVFKVSSDANKLLQVLFQKFRK